MLATSPKGPGDRRHQAAALGQKVLAATPMVGPAAHTMFGTVPRAVGMAAGAIPMRPKAALEGLRRYWARRRAENTIK